MKVYSGIYHLIGHTPLMEIKHFELPEGVRLFAKLEFFNPGGSIKDRLGKELVENALQEGFVRSGGTIIEPTAGNTGIGLALAALQYDLRIILCVPKKFSMEKQELMRALGAIVINTPTEQGMKGAIAKAKELLQDIPNAYCPQQFANEANPHTYYKTLGPELWEDLNGRIDIFVAGAGTGGTFMGTARYLKEQNPNIKVLGVDAFGSVLKKYHETREFDNDEIYPYRIEGLGKNLIPTATDFDAIDKFTKVTDEESAHTAREIAKKEGLFVGYTSGAAMQAIKQFAEDGEFDENSNVVVIFPDHGSRYMSKVFSDEWMNEQGFFDSVNAEEAQKIEFIK